MKYATTILYILLFTSLTVGAEVFEQKQLTLETQENKGFYEALSFRESTNNPYATNNEGAIGKYQILQRTLKGLGYDWVTLETFRADPTIFPETLQQEALNRKIIGDLKLLQKQWFRKDSSINYLSFIGDTINNIPITLAGIIASCHIGGSMGTIRWFDSLGKRNPGDTNRSTIGAYMLEFSVYSFNLKELQCSTHSGNGLILSTKQSKSSTTEQKSKDTGTAMILRSHTLSIRSTVKTVSTKQIEYLSESKQSCPKVMVLFLIFVVLRQEDMDISMFQASVKWKEIIVGCGTV